MADSRDRKRSLDESVSQSTTGLVEGSSILTQGHG